jgi:hypothetical protein
MKWVYVRFRGLRSHSRYEFYLVPIPPELTVSQFKSLWEDGSEIIVYTPTRMLPLSGDVKLYDCIEEFDTVFIASTWIIAQSSDNPSVRRAAHTTDTLH